MEIVPYTSTEPAAGIALCEMETLRAYRSNWPADTRSFIIENFMYDERVPDVCYVYPPAAEGTYVELVHVVAPTDCTSGSSPLSVADSYANALIFLVLARAYEKDAENRTMAEVYYKRCLRSLGLKTEPDKKSSPNLMNQGGDVPRDLR
jgi:hypothetical protein